jgi:hypothetical protein
MTPRIVGGLIRLIVTRASPLEVSLGPMQTLHYPVHLRVTGRA